MLCSFVDICSRCSSLHVCCTSQRACGRTCCSNFLNVLVRMYMILLAYLGSSIMPWVRACCGIVAISTSQWNCLVLSPSTSSWSVVSHGVAEGARETEIRRHQLGLTRGHRHGGGFPKDSCWQYKCPFRKTWVDVSKEEDRQLKEAYRSLPKGAWNWIVRLWVPDWGCSLRNALSMSGQKTAVASRLWLVPDLRLDSPTIPDLLEKMDEWSTLHHAFRVFGGCWHHRWLSCGSMQRWH